VLTVEPGAYFAFDDSLLAELNGEGITIHRTKTLDPTTRSSGRKLVPFPEESKRRFLSWASQFFLIPDNKIGWKGPAVRAAKQLMKERPFDLIYATAPPYTALMVGAEISRIERLPLVLDYRDDWLMNPRHSYPTKVHRSISASKEAEVLKEASVVLTINETIAGLVGERAPDISTVVVPQGFDPADFSAKDLDEIDSRNTADQNRQMVFLYSGMFYDAQQPDVFLKALKNVLEDQPELKQKVVASFVGLLSDRVIKLVADLGLESVVRTNGYQDHSASVAELKKCDVAWMTVGRQEGEEMISTGKLFEYIGSGKPILALVPDGEAKTALLDYEASFICPPDDQKKIEMEIGRLVKLWEDSALPEGRNDENSRYDRRHLARKVADIFNSLLD